MIVKYPIYSCYVNKFEFAGWQFIQKLQHDKSLIYFTDIRYFITVTLSQYKPKGGCIGIMRVS